MSYHWTNENIFKLIDMFEKKELLWNNGVEDYRDRNKKHEAWCEIANAFNVDKQVIEKKIKSLIGQFQREWKRAKPGAGEISHWFAFKRMMFIRNRTTPMKHTENSNTNSDNDLETQYSYDEDNDDNTNQSIDINIDQNRSFDTSTTLMRKRKLTKLPMSKSDERIQEAIKKIAKGLTSTMKSIAEKRDDEFDIFGKYVASTLRSLPAELAIFAKTDIQKALSDTQLRGLRANSQPVNLVNGYNIPQGINDVCHTIKNEPGEG